ncbi:MAG: GNAT family N-acetyltransferase [Leptolyngbya sp. SIO1D8]|nr:GNAT family N-acetyltransferase [Leptolyngbya sp. SIO1D8]
MNFPVSGYCLRRGSEQDRSLLVRFLCKTYEETVKTTSFIHLTETVSQHFSDETPIWWVETETQSQHPVACLWLGNAVDQLQGDRHGYVLMLYVLPEHRRQGIATALLETAQDWSRARGDRQIGLQAFADNAAAIALYRKLGYQIHSLWLTKPL